MKDYENKYDGGRDYVRYKVMVNLKTIKRLLNKLFKRKDTYVKRLRKRRM